MSSITLKNASPAFYCDYQSRKQLPKDKAHKRKFSIAGCSLSDLEKYSQMTEEKTLSAVEEMLQSITLSPLGDYLYKSKGTSPT